MDIVWELVPVTITVTFWLLPIVVVWWVVRVLADIRRDVRRIADATRDSREANDAT